MNLYAKLLTLKIGEFLLPEEVLTGKIKHHGKNNTEINYEKDFKKQNIISVPETPLFFLREKKCNIIVPNMYILV